MQSTEREYKTTWPETVVLWGAGATAAIGLPTTIKIGERICRLGHHKDTLENRVREGFPKEDETESAHLVDLLLLLGDRCSRGLDAPDICRVYRKHFKSNATDLEAVREIEGLRALYDWDTLAQLIRLCPSGENPDRFQLVDLFNLIDMHLATGHGFRGFGDSEKESFIRPESLIPARNALKMLTGLMMFLAWREARSGNQTILNQYRAFCGILARLMQREGLEIRDEGYEYFDQRHFYLFSYAVISLNWDPIFMWLIFNAHKDANNSSSTPHVGTPAVPLKMFNDLGHFMGVRRVDALEPLVWYPCNETAVQRLNDREHQADRLLRVGKFYFPHGSTSFRECPNCGKLIVAFGDEWEALSETLFPPPLLRCFSEGSGWNKYRRCAQEVGSFRAGNGDAIICSFCATMTEARHTPLIMQSSFKGIHPPFIEEIQRDMRVALENAKHIVLLGYSLPEDDFIYRALLSARKRRKHPPYCTILNFDENLPRGWLTESELPLVKKEDWSKQRPTVVDQAVAIFGKENVRANFEGMPRALLSGDSVNPAMVSDLLYPSSVFKESIARSRRGES